MRKVPSQTPPPLSADSVVMVRKAADVRWSPCEGAIHSEPPWDGRYVGFASLCLYQVHWLAFELLEQTTDVIAATHVNVIAGPVFWRPREFVVQKSAPGESTTCGVVFQTVCEGRHVWEASVKLDFRRKRGLALGSNRTPLGTFFAIRLWHAFAHSRIGIGLIVAGHGIVSSDEAIDGVAHHDEDGVCGGKHLV